MLAGFENKSMNSSPQNESEIESDPKSDENDDEMSQTRKEINNYFRSSTFESYSISKKSTFKSISKNTIPGLTPSDSVNKKLSDPFSFRTDSNLVVGGLDKNKKLEFSCIKEEHHSEDESPEIHSKVSHKGILKHKSLYRMSKTPSGAGAGQKKIKKFGSFKLEDYETKQAEPVLNKLETIESADSGKQMNKKIAELKIDSFDEKNFDKKLQDFGQKSNKNAIEEVNRREQDLFSPYYNAKRRHIDLDMEKSSPKFNDFDKKNRSFDLGSRREMFQRKSNTTNQLADISKFSNSKQDTPKNKKKNKFSKLKTLRKASKKFLAPLKKIKKMIPDAERTEKKEYFNKCPICNKNIEFLYKVSFGTLVLKNVQKLKNNRNLGV